MSELERLEHRRQLVAADVAQNAGPKIPPAAPGERMISRMIRTLGRRAEPEVPAQMAGRGRRLWRTPNPAGRDRRKTVRAGMNFAHGANRARRNRFSDQPRRFAGLALVSHLSGQ